MAQTEPDMPESEEPTPNDTPEPPAAPVSRRPDWLVGAEDGVTAELSRKGARADAPALRLVRPAEVVEPAEGEEGDPKREDGGPTSLPRVTLMRPDEGAHAAHPIGRPLPPAAPERTAAWSAAASSIPTLRRKSAPPAATKGASRPDFGGDDEMATTTEPDEKAATPTPSAPRVVLPPLREAWWEVVLDAVQHNRMVQVGLGAVVLIFVAVTFWPNGEPSVSLSTVRHHPTQFDGQTVTLHGRVGDIYPIAGGFTYYLRQGRDTIVVFTHGRAPISEQNITVQGTITTGYLDGLPRQALFENSH
jgi:hypothetical protein